MNKITTYFVNFTAKLNRIVSKNNSFGDVYKALKNNRIKFNDKYDFEETKKKLEEFNKVLDKVISIIYAPHIEVSTSEIVIRSEQAGRLSRESFFDTTRDTKLWKRKNHELTPEYVHTKENIDTIDNYENRFISLLVSKISDEFEIIRNSMEFVSDSLEEHFETSGITFNEYSIFNSFKEFSYPYEGIFVKPLTSVARINKLINRLNKRIKNIKGTTFYKITSKKKIADAIMLTNVLLHDEKYNYCYKYYKNNYLFENKESFDFNIAFKNYVKASLINYLVKSAVGRSGANLKSKVYLDETKNFHFNKIIFKKDIFSYFMSEDYDGVIVEVHFLNESKYTKLKVGDNRLARFYLLPVFSLDEDNKDYINERLLSLSKNYDNVILITMANYLHEYNNSICLSVFKSNHDILFKNLFSSFTMLFLVDSEEYKFKCPVCGAKNVYRKDDHFECSKCNSSFSFVDVKGEDALWIKSLRRKY